LQYYHFIWRLAGIGTARPLTATDKRSIHNMKHMALMTILAATGSVVLAQQGGGGVGAPVAGGAPALAVVPSAATISSTTNATGKPDVAKLQALYAELITISKELQPEEQILQASDADLKALNEKKLLAQQGLRDLENQRRALVDAKLSADPKVAPLVARRRELQQSLSELRPPMSPATNARENHAGYGARPMSPMGGAEPLRPEIAPKTVLPPTTTPAADLSGQTGVPASQTPAKTP
jgi:hypothetical protein